MPEMADWWRLIIQFKTSDPPNCQALIPITYKKYNFIHCELQSIFFFVFFSVTNYISIIVGANWISVHFLQSPLNVSSYLFSCPLNADLALQLKKFNEMCKIFKSLFFDGLVFWKWRRKHVFDHFHWKFKWICCFSATQTHFAVAAKATHIYFLFDNV